MAYDVTFIPGDGTGPEIAEATKLGCPISRLLNAELSLEAKLEA